MNKHKQVVLDRNKVLSQIQRLAEVAKTDNWQYEYDAQLDELVYGKDFMPRDSFLFNVNGEINLFISPDSSVSGIHIEYFQANYLAHNQELQPALRAITKKTIKNQRDNEAATALEIELSADAFKSLFSKDQLITVL
ncbi:hypothetical protein AUK57_02220 [Candidatus Saccharibacteria bacterium CG2_30_41_52]|nr:MAG: hypothetical protein AUK57_02220 [Candidatus Saccharibacteria bacterium CG2_30_41_52]PJE66151.1 MAG: hypothetical protein COU92_01845 [Candidatus Saccharibacteria bacterium CG10_big_fil_rev_8_21_14_0_10_41_32]